MAWTRNGVSIAGGEFLGVTQGGVYECAASNECGQTVGRSEVFGKLTQLIDKTDSLSIGLLDIL